MKNFARALLAGFGDANGSAYSWSGSQVKVGDEGMREAAWSKCVTVQILPGLQSSASQ